VPVIEVSQESEPQMTINLELSVLSSIILLSVAARQDESSMRVREQMYPRSSHCHLHRQHLEANSIYAQNYAVKMVFLARLNYYREALK
jgi:hypothetical protein